MDGANFRFQLHHETENLLFGSRNVEFKEDGAPLPVSEIDGNFNQVTNYLSETVDPETVKELEDRLGTRLVFFGENMVKHSLDYNWDEVPAFLGFDVYHVDEERYLDLETAYDLFERLGLPTAPFLELVEEPARFEDYEVPESKWRDGKAEGVVLKNYRSQLFAKLVSDEFKEKNQKAFGGRNRSPGKVIEKIRSYLSSIDEDADAEKLHGQQKNAVNQIRGVLEQENETDVDELVATYCTNARIRKQIKKLTVDEGRDLEMELMRDLYARVYDDIWIEEGDEIWWTSKTVQFKEMRDRVASRCASVLETMIKNQAIQGENR